MGDVEVELQQCENLNALLRSLDALSTSEVVHSATRQALADLPSLLEAYTAGIKEPRWCAERPQELEDASEALLALLSADDERCLEEQLPLGEEVLELVKGA